jgi:hypothetical protein
MIEKALPGLFKAITEEAAANPAFARKLEASLAKFAVDFKEGQAAEQAVAGFHPLIEYRKGTPEAFLARLMKFDARELRLLVDAHKLDPASELKPKASKKALAEHIFAAASRRAERDAKLFEY